MKSYICLLLTSNGCGHCAAFRGDGLINNGKAYMKKEYISSLFDEAKNVKLNLLNIHYENMSGQPQFISDISKFSMTKRGVMQQRYFRYENKARLRSIVAKHKRRELGVDDVLSEGKKVDWLTFVREKIPDQIKNYTYYFPCFLMVETEDWKKALKSPSYPLYALPNAGKVIKENNIIKLDRNPASLNSRNMDVKRMINQVAAGQLAIRTESDVLEEKKMEIKKVETSQKFLIKSYDD